MDEELKGKLADTLVYMNSDWGHRLFQHYSPKTMRYVIENLFLIIDIEGYIVVKKEESQALEESVKLQAHYAELLNMHDGGERIIFKSVKDWIERLRHIKGG